MMRRIARSIFALLLSLVILQRGLTGVGASRDDYPRSSEVDALQYRITLEIKNAEDEITAQTEILLEFLKDGVKRINLDFAGLAARQVTESRKAARFTQIGERLSIDLNGDYHKGDQVWIAVSYSGRPKDGLYIKKNKFGDRTVFADNWPNRAHYWFPAIDHPYDKATVEFLITAPDRYDVVANGILLETTSQQNGTKLWHWSESVPIPTYCMTLGAAAFSIIGVGCSQGSACPVPIQYYVYPGDRDGAFRDYGRTTKMLAFYSELIGPYPYKKLALVESSTRFGGMENASNIFFDEKAYDGSGHLEGTVAHEIAHQWFGDSVTEADWHHLWLSEGFATYFGHLFFEREEGRDKLVRLMREDKNAYLSANASNPRPICDPAVTDLFKLLNANNYQKAAWVLHMLRHIMGNEKFFEGIRDYYQTYRNRNALTADFQKVMESHAGRSLDWFFKEWIFGPGHPIYDASWRWNEQSKELNLKIVQKQPVAQFTMPLDIEIKLADGVRRELITVGEREQSFTFKLSGRPSQLVLDPDEWVLMVSTVTEQR
jgi:aminopeptidase N